MQLLREAGDQEMLQVQEGAILVGSLLSVFRVRLDVSLVLSSKKRLFGPDNCSRRLFYFKKNKKNYLES